MERSVLMIFTAMQAFYEAKKTLTSCFWIAYSGGLDSHVLLSVSSALRNKFSLPLKVIHVNHNLHVQSAEWAHHCRRVCEHYDIDYVEETIQCIPQPKESLEEIARNQRYGLFKHLLQKNDILLTAHHQDDQAETVLLQLFRGSGPLGLAAMPEIKIFSAGWHARPFLSFSRSQLAAYAKHAQLNWIEDHSNDDTRYTRNFLRHCILPVLKQRWPTISATIARTSHHCREAETYLTTCLNKQLKQLYGHTPGCLSVSALLLFSAIDQRLLLRTWIKAEGYRVPNMKKMHTIQTRVLTAEPDRTPSVSWQRVTLKRYQNELYLLSDQLKISSGGMTFPIHWRLKDRLVLPGKGTLHTLLKSGCGLHLSIEAVNVSFRVGGEMLHRSTNRRSKLKKVLQEWHVPPWQRNQLPLIIIDNKLIGVVGYFIHPAYCAEPCEIGREIVFLKE